MNETTEPKATTVRKSTERTGIGTAPVFLASISTILGAIMFLRFGHAVANVGMVGTLLIIFLGHLVTIPTALAIAEIATNRRVEGGGEFFIISRSFGTTIGGSIGVALYFSQALSIAFYMIAFAEAFGPLVPQIESLIGMSFDPRMISFPMTFLMVLLVYYRGLNIGVAALWVVGGVLALSLALFFLGKPPEGVEVGTVGLLSKIENAEPFMVIFAIIFPAFTGMTAGVGLSGDLARPRRSIPLGILAATFVGVIVYVVLVLKLAVSLPLDVLAEDQLAMSRIALWGPIIPIGLACATLSSSLGSILVAPRTLQAMAKDRVVPIRQINRFLASGHGEANNPRNATIITGVLALFTVSIGSVDFVARIISMFFMVTYGSLCAISFLEHFAARPSYRPSFRSRWYISLLGAVMCLFLMFQMEPLYALLAILAMAGIYQMIRKSRGEQWDDLGLIFRGVFTQLTRYMQIRMQRANLRRFPTDWRPSVITVDGRTFDRSAPLQFLTWLCHRYGFATYLHFIEGEVNTETYQESRSVLSRLIKTTHAKESAAYVDTIVSPSISEALAQTLQLPGISGMENNTILFSYSTHDGAETLEEIHEGCTMASAMNMNSLVLRHSDQFFGSRMKIHIWLTWHDYRNANLMILLGYILLGHPDWSKAEISIYAAFPKDEAQEQTVKLHELISAGRIPVTERRIRIIPTDDEVNYSDLVRRRSTEADLVILGFTKERLDKKGSQFFERHPELGDVLWVSAQERILIE